MIDGLAKQLAAQAPGIGVGGMSAPRLHSGPAIGWCFESCGHVISHSAQLVSHPLDAVLAQQPVRRVDPITQEIQRSPAWQGDGEYLRLVVRF